MSKYKTYLVGSIQDAPDGGVSWREKLTKSLVEFGFEVQDPCKMECNHSLAATVEEQKKKLENLKRGGEWEVWDRVMHDIRQSDLVCVNNSKFLIALYDPSKKYGGTIHEIVEAWQKGIAIYTVSYQPFMEFNDWILALLRDNFRDGGKVFHNFKQLTDFLSVEYKDYIAKVTIKEETK
jgi:hypothetical protein